MKYLYRHLKPFIAVVLILGGGIIFGKSFDGPTLVGTVLIGIGV